MTRRAPKREWRVCIYGMGNQGRIVYDILRRRAEYTVACFCDDAPRISTLFGVPVLRPPIDRACDLVVLAMGNDSRARVAQKERLAAGIEQPLLTVVDSSCVIGHDVVLGRGVICHPSSTVMTGTRVGEFSIVSTAASIDHDSVLEDYVNVCPGVRGAGSVYLERGAFIGTGAVLLPRVRVGQFATVGAGAVVTRDVPPYSTVVGVPARVIRKEADRE